MLLSVYTGSYIHSKTKTLDHSTTDERVKHLSSVHVQHIAVNIHWRDLEMPLNSSYTT